MFLRFSYDDTDNFTRESGESIMSFGQILTIILIVILIAMVILYFVGKRNQRRQAETEAQLEAMKQVCSMLIIDKKLLKLKQSGLPQAVIDNTPVYLRWTKMPIVKAKVGPRIMILAAERDVWDVLPVKQEVKVELSGIYITAIKSVRGGSVLQKTKKKGLLDKLRERAKKN
jgi:hypothetical protein